MSLLGHPIHGLPPSLCLRARWHANTKNELQGFRKRSICINDPLKRSWVHWVQSSYADPWKKKCSKYYKSEAGGILKYPPGNPIIYSPYQPARNVWNRWFSELPQVGYMVYGCIWIPSLWVFFFGTFLRARRRRQRACWMQVQRRRRRPWYPVANVAFSRWFKDFMTWNNFLDSFRCLEFPFEFKEIQVGEMVKDERFHWNITNTKVKVSKWIHGALSHISKFLICFV